MGALAAGDGTCDVALGVDITDARLAAGLSFRWGRGRGSWQPCGSGPCKRRAGAHLHAPACTARTACCRRYRRRPPAASPPCEAGTACWYRRRTPGPTTGCSLTPLSGALQPGWAGAGWLPWAGPAERCAGGLPRCGAGSGTAALPPHPPRPCACRQLWVAIVATCVGERCPGGATCTPERSKCRRHGCAPRSAQLPAARPPPPLSPSLAAVVGGIVWAAERYAWIRPPRRMPALPGLQERVWTSLGRPMQVRCSGRARGRSQPSLRRRCQYANPPCRPRPRAEHRHDGRQLQRQSRDPGVCFFRPRADHPVHRQHWWAGCRLCREGSGHQGVHCRPGGTLPLCLWPPLTPRSPASIGHASRSCKPDGAGAPEPHPRGGRPAGQARGHVGGAARRRAVRRRMPASPPVVRRCAWQARVPPQPLPLLLLKQPLLASCPPTAPTAPHQLVASWRSTAPHCTLLQLHRRMTTTSPTCGAAT